MTFLKIAGPKTLLANALVALAVSFAPSSGAAQTIPPPAAPASPASPAASAAATPSTQVDDVIRLFKDGLSEDVIIASLRKNAEPADLSPADLVKLKEAGVPEAIMVVMMDPKGAASPSPAAPHAATTVAGAAANPVGVAAIPDALKKRVVVYTFDFKPNQQVGEVIRSMLQERLSKQGEVVVVERAAIDDIQKELKRNADGSVQSGTGAQVGRFSGVDAALTGDVIIFGRDDKKHTAGAQVVSGICDACGAFVRTKTEEKAVVAIDYRFINAATSEVVAVGEARGESKRTSKSWGAPATSNGIGTDMTKSNFADTIVGEATMDCVNKLADLFTKQVQGMKAKRPELEAYVAEISDGGMVVTAGSNDNVNAGDVFEIFKIDGLVRDPNTKEVLDRQVTKVGECTISEVRDRISTGAYVGSPAENGFLARRKQ
jgi:curli biogenesis system outer membrane secretion channel CsgG